MHSNRPMTSEYTRMTKVDRQTDRQICITRNPLAQVSDMSNSEQRAQSLPEDLESDLRWWSKPSRVHSSADLSSLRKLVEGTKSFLRSDLLSFVASCGDRPVLLAYAGDGTAARTRTVIASRSGESTVHRSGKKGTEFLVHHVFACSVDSFGNRHSRVLFEDPRPMTEGKTSAAEVSLGRHFCSFRRVEPHRGVVIVQLSWDRAKFEAIARCRISQDTADQVPEAR